MSGESGDLDDARGEHECCSISIADVLLTSSKAFGLAANEDLNGAAQAGVGRAQSTTRDGRRCRAATVFLRPAMDRPNLEVTTNALRLLFEGRRAVGVEDERFGSV